MAVNRPLSAFTRLLLTLYCLLLLSASCFTVSGTRPVPGSVVKREDRTLIAQTEYGEISAVDIGDGWRGDYHVQFITLEPNALFLPVLLHAEMVLFVRTGSGRLTWVGEDDTQKVHLGCGDIYRLTPGTMFHIRNDLEQGQHEKLRIYAIFTNTDGDHYDPLVGSYSNVADLLRGFDKRILCEAFNAPEEVIDEIMSADRPLPIICADTKSKVRIFFEQEARKLKSYLTAAESIVYHKKKKEAEVFNVYNADKDFENGNGWSLTVTRKDDHSLRGAHLGIFMVNLTKGSMMGPHWNPRATEVAIALHGQGMVRVVCSGSAKESQCNNSRFKVNEGDVFMVPRFHPVAQMSYNNESFVFMGFSTTTHRTYPQFFAGRSSVLHELGKNVLAAAFNVPNTTVDQLMKAQADSVILGCTSCAEEEERLMVEEERQRRDEEELWQREEAWRRERARREETERWQQEGEEGGRSRPVMEEQFDMAA